MMPVKQVFLIKPKVNGKPTGGVPLAEDYLVNVTNHSSQWLLEAIMRIFNILNQLTLTESGEISELKELVNYQGVSYQGIEDYFNYDPKHPEKRIEYSMLKKLKAGNNAYEIRFRNNEANRFKECRVVLTVHKDLNCLVLTHGFSKVRKINYYYGIGDANEVTTQLGKVANDLFNILNDEINGSNETNMYLGKEGERHEVEL